MENGCYYGDVVERHGVSAQGVHWNSEVTQYKRFEVLLSMIDLSEEDTLADAGCGFAELFFYLQKQHISLGQYIGLELMEEMVSAAKKRADLDLRVCDVLHDALPKADYYFCSGGMNILTREETELFIRRCFAASSKGFVFNLLEGDDDSLLYNYYQPEEIVSMAEVLDADFSLKQGYLPRDFSVVLLHKSAVRSL